MTRELCRVHWLLWCLPPQFKGAYRMEYNYKFHKYLFYRMNGRKHRIYDVFTVIRTSKRCFRIMYVNAEIKEFLYFSCTTSEEAGQRMNEIFEMYRDIEEEI